MPSASSVDADHDLNSASKSEYWTLFRDYLLPIVAIIAVATLLYFRVYAFKFSIIDDSSTIYQNPYLDAPGAQNIGYLWRHSYYALYMPVTYTLWGLLARIDKFPHLTLVPPGGNNASFINPEVFHLASLGLHAATSVLVFLILRRLRFAAWPSLAGALFFVVHPVQVQSVAWITGMNNLTGGFLGFLAIYLYLCQIPSDGISASARGTNRGRAWILLSLATVVFVAALLAKPTATLTPLLIIAIEFFGLRRPALRWLPLMLFWSAMSIVCAVGTWFTSKPVSGRIWSPLWGRPFVVGDALAFYLGKVVVPIRLTLDYGRTPRQVLGHTWGYLTWLLPCALLVALNLWKRSRSKMETQQLYTWCVVSLALFVAGLLPVLGLVPFYTQRVSTVCDRYLYAAMLGPAVLLAALLSQVRSRQVLAAIVTVSALSLLSLQTSLLLPAWRDMSTQTNEMLQHNPESAMAHQNEGMILLEQNHMDLALPEFEMAMKYDPEADNHAYFTGIALESLDRQSEAVGPLQTAFDLDPVNPQNWYELWNVLTYLKRYDEAVTIVKRRLMVVPEDSFAEFTLGKTLVVDRKPREALPYLLHVAREKPSEGAIEYFIGSVYEQLGEPSNALEAYHKANALDPGHQETKDAISRLEAL